MKLQFIITIALSVTIPSVSLWPWESLVCIINSTDDIGCDFNQTNASCQFSGMTGPVTVTMLESNRQSINFTISRPYEHCPTTTTATKETTVVVTSTPYTNWSCPDSKPVTLEELTDCDSKGILCLVLIGLGCIITFLVATILVLCVVITCLVARGKRHQYTPGVVLTQSSATQNQIQEEEQASPSGAQNQDSGNQQANLYHILDPQYDTVDNKTNTSQPTSEPVQYCEPEPLTHVQAEVTEHKGLTGSGAQSSKPQASLSLDKIDEQDTGVFYDELTGPGYPKGLKPSEHSATSLPTIAVPRYSSLNQEENTQQCLQEVLLPLYSMPDKSKKKDKDGGKKVRETELTSPQGLMVRSPTESKPPFTTERKQSGQGGELGITRPPKSRSPPPPTLPPKPGQAGIQEELEEEAYAEVSSRPITSAQARNRTPGAIGTTVSPLHLMSQNLASTERETGNFRRSYSMEGYFGSEVLRHQKASDLDFRQLYDAPMNPSLHTRGMAPHQERREEEEEEERRGFFRAS